MDNAGEKDKNIHKGHRQKVKQRFYENGMDGMPVHNVLEMLLFFGIPQRDTNPLAHKLIEKFGSFSAVLEARREDLMAVKGMTESAACLLTMILPLYKQYKNDLQRKRVVLESTEDYVEYIKHQFYDTLNERVYIICLDSNNRAINSFKVGEGDFSSVIMNMREIVSCVLHSQAKKVVLCHNHPHGVTAPSKADADATLQLYNILTGLSVSLIDHIIFTENDYFSFSKSIKYSSIFYGLGITEVKKKNK